MRQELLDTVRRQCLGDIAAMLDQLTLDDDAREAIEAGLTDTFDELLHAVEHEPFERNARLPAIRFTFTRAWPIVVARLAPALVEAQTGKAELGRKVRGMIEAVQREGAASA